MLSRRTGPSGFLVSTGPDTLTPAHRCSDQGRIHPLIGTPRFQNGSIVRWKNKTAVRHAYSRFYEEVDGRRVYRKQRIGTVREFPHRRDVEKEVLRLRAKINSDVRSPETVSALIHHYKKHFTGEQ